jgi:hypothetical protein
MNERRTDSEPMTDFERSAKQAFDASCRELDGATRARLVQARERALDAAGRPKLGLGWSWSLAPGGALAAAALVALLLVAHRDRPTDLASQQLAPGDLEILLGQEDLAMLDDDIEFYSWLEDQPEITLGANGDGVG